MTISRANPQVLPQVINRRRCIARLCGSIATLTGAASLVACGGGGGDDEPVRSGLVYSSDLAQPYPIPPGERSLISVVAEPYFQVSTSGLQLEAAAFDRNGNLFFVEIFGGRIFSLSPAKSLTTFLAPNSMGPAGIAIHKDGRIFVAGLGNLRDTGSIFYLNPDGSGLTTVVPAGAGFVPDDLVFDSAGGIYFTDFKGDPSSPVGGVYYMSPDFSSISPVVRNMAVGNGVCLSPDGSVLWATEMSAGKLHRVSLNAPGSVADFGASVPYYFTGFGPDSMRTDADGNVYVAMYTQGRVLVFNRNGVPIGQILLPKRETGHNMGSTSLAFVPGTNECLILSNDGTGGEGSWIFKANGFARGTTLYSHQ